MKALSSAAALAVDPIFQAVVMAALTYRARQIVSDQVAAEPPEVALASAVVTNPEAFRQVAWVVATDPAIATAGTAYTEEQVIAGVNAVWAYLARLG